MLQAIIAEVGLTNVIIGAIAYSLIALAIITIAGSWMLYFFSRAWYRGKRNGTDRALEKQVTNLFNN